VIVRWIGPGGDRRLDLTLERYQREHALLLTPTAGRYVLEISLAPTDPAGQYVIDSGPPRPAVPEDRDRLAAEELTIKGKALLHSGNRESGNRESVLKGIPVLETALAMWQRLGDEIDEADSSALLAEAYVWANQPQRALPLWARALAILKRAGDRHAYAVALLHAAEAKMVVYHMPEGIASYQEAVALSHELQLPYLEVLGRANLAAACSRASDTECAIRTAEEALPLLRALQLPEGEAAALSTIAKARWRRGEFSEAIVAGLEALRIQRDAKLAIRVPATLTTIAKSYIALGDPAGALVYLEEASQAPRPAGSLPQRASTLEDLAIAHERLGDPDRALEYRRKALELSSEAADPLAEAHSRLGIAEMHNESGRWPEAIAEAEQALARLRSVSDRFELARGLQVLAMAELGRGQVAQAEAALSEALGYRREIGDQAGEANALQLLGRAAQRRGALAEARTYFEEALRLVEGQQTRITSLDLRASWVASVRSVYEDYVGVLMSLHRREPSAGLDVTAFRASEAAHARSLLELLSEPGIVHEVSPALLEEQRSAQERLASALDRQMRLLSRPHDEADRAELAKEVEAFTIAYGQAEARIRAASPEWASLRHPEPLSLDEIRARVVDRDTLLLEYTLGTERSYLWTVGAQSLHVYELPARGQIEAAARRASEALTSRPVPGSTSRNRSALAELASLILAPVSPELRGQRLLIVADGVLHHIPFAALPEASGRPLVETHEVITLPSASVLAMLRAARAGRPPAPKTLAVLADPVFDRHDERLTSAATSAAKERPDPRIESATRDFRFAGGRLPRLPFTRREAQQILALVPPTARRSALDFDASRATVMDPDLGRYRFLHFATHGLVNSARPELSGIVLSLVDPQGGEVRGFLAAPDVSRLRLEADLVVLSGCATALGRELSGEGLLGLTRAFLYAGARGVVASLWRVDDLATAELMTRFYSGLLGPKRLNAAAALRAAQLSLQKTGPWSEPYYWAGFQLQGDWTSSPASAATR
jgi:CHAT domain-containing protein/tetratricopeptide (TPR) repeat protein